MFCPSFFLLGLLHSRKSDELAEGEYERRQSNEDTGNGRRKHHQAKTQGNYGSHQPFVGLILGRLTFCILIQINGRKHQSQGD